MLQSLTMMRSPMRIAIALISVALFCANAAARAESSNDLVLRVARSYSDGGGYNLKWGGTGTPEEILHDGQRVLAKGTDGTYCCGFTFAVAMKGGQQLNLFEGKSIEQIKRFQKEWYGAVEEPELREKQCSLAVGNLGIGRAVPFDEAQPGDFCQFWRGKSGHSVIFLGWAERDGKRIGIRYRSSQGSTNGIGDTVEYFNDTGIENGRVDRNRVYFGRFTTQ